MLNSVFLQLNSLGASINLEAVAMSDCSEFFCKTSLDFLWEIMQSQAGDIS